MVNSSAMSNLQRKQNEIASENKRKKFLDWVFSHKLHGLSLLWIKLLVTLCPMTI